MSRAHVAVIRITFTDGILAAFGTKRGLRKPRIRDLREHLQEVLCDEIDHLMTDSDENLEPLLEASIARARRKRAS